MNKARTVDHMMQKTAARGIPTVEDHGNVIQSKRYGDLILVECNLQIRESIAGFTESSGPNEITVPYPLDKSKGLYYDVSRFTRNYFTTGVILSHPLLDNGVKCSVIAEMLYEAFFMVIPFERQDIDFGSDKHRADRKEFKKGGRFLSLFDQTYGSLRLTSRFLDHDVVEKAFQYAIEIAENDLRYGWFHEEITVLKCIGKELEHPPMQDALSETPNLLQEDNINRVVILPETVGLDIRNGRNEEFFVKSIFFSPTYGLSYKGRHLSETSKRMTTETWRSRIPVMIVPVDGLEEIPGESKMGLYNLETGEISAGSEVNSNRPVAHKQTGIT